MKFLTLISTSLVISGSFLLVAQAAPPSDVPTAVVKFGDIDTIHPAGKKELYRRLSRAAQSVCGPGGSQKALVTPQYEACIAQALSGAVAQFNRPDFTDYVATRSQKSVSANTRLATR